MSVFSRLKKHNVLENDLEVSNRDFEFRSSSNFYNFQ